MTTVPNAEAPLQSKDEIKETTLQRKTGRLTIKYRVRGHVVRMRVKENNKENNKIKTVRLCGDRPSRRRADERPSLRQPTTLNIKCAPPRHRLGSDGTGQDRTGQMETRNNTTPLEHVIA